MTRQRKPRQLPLHFPKRGGPRKGAGRKPRIPGRPGVPHRPRADLGGRPQPLHVTLRMADHVWNLRSARSFRVLRRCLLGAADQFDVRLVEYSIQGNHIHLLAEAADRHRLASAIKGLSVRIARRMNHLMDRRGAVLADRFHSRPLRTPTEVRRARTYIRENARKHAAQRGDRLPPGWVDPHSSAARLIPLPAPTTWLLSTGWRRGGP